MELIVVHVVVEELPVVGKLEVVELIVGHVVVEELTVAAYVEVEGAPVQSVRDERR